MMGPWKFILDADGNPEPCEDILAWGRWMQGADEQRRVARDEVFGIKVSTVFLGLDHSHAFGSNAVPILWETTIFANGRDTEFDLWQRRYASKEEALIGHAEAVEMVKAEQRRG